MRNTFPGKTWTSIAILCNPKMGLHRDLMNLKRPHESRRNSLGHSPEDAFGWKMKMEMRRRKFK